MADLIQNFKATTINNALTNIASSKYLLPAIQRKFVWKSEQIEKLFDSIMQGYPINTFMLWKITDSNIKNNHKFYDFLLHYKEHFHENNEHHVTNARTEDFYAVIDGQQRLTSLYVGLQGTYAYKLPRVWYIECEENFPTRKLYIDLSGEYQDDNDERTMKYNFKFLSQSDLEKAVGKEDQEWFALHDLYKFSDEDEFLEYVYSYEWKNKTFAKKTLSSLYRKVFKEPLINYYQEDKQEIDKVLDIFIRTNRGGEPLSYSNLLMSFVTAYWQKDTRTEFQRLCEQVFTIGNPGFMIDSDFILKTCLVLFSKDIKFRLNNFKTEVVSEIEENWERISRCIREAFRLIESWGFNYSNMKARNAVIPIVYYIYSHDIEKTINDNPLMHKEEKDEMRKWFCISLLRHVFGGQSDYVLKGIRDVLNEHTSDNRFPFEEIKETFKGNQAKSLSFNEEVIDGLLSLHKDDPSCYPVMALIYSHFDFGNQVYHKDHLHPAAYFVNLKKEDWMSEEDFYFYKDSENWDTMPNLQLLNGTLNESKNARPLDEWIKERNIDLDNQLIPKDVSLDVRNFKEFISKRKVLLKERLMAIVH